MLICLFVPDSSLWKLKKLGFPKDSSKSRFQIQAMLTDVYQTNVNSNVKVRKNWT